MPSVAWVTFRHYWDPAVKAGLFLTCCFSFLGLSKHKSGGSELMMDTWALAHTEEGLQKRLPSNENLVSPGVLYKAQSRIR